MKTYSINKQNINREDIKIVSQSLKEDLITTGKNVEKFELNIKIKSNLST